MRICLLLLGITLFTQNAFSQVDFTVDTTNNCAPAVIKFMDATSGNPVQWDWVLGNGIVSTQQNPSTIYFTPGTYTIKLLATFADGKEGSKSYTVTVHNRPTVIFSVIDSLSGCIPLTVHFKDSITSTDLGTQSSWLWYFGDGSIDSVPNPIHTYTSVNNFGVVLTVKNSFGCSQTLGQSKYINAKGIIAAFNFNSINICQPQILTFTNISTPAPTINQWDFGNGITSQDTSPVFTYNAAGKYQVQLIATSSEGCTNTFVQPISIKTVSPDFIFVNSCFGQTTNFTNKSTPTPLSVEWNFGDGTPISSVTNPVHTYNTIGTFPVIMKADFGGCIVSDTENVIISKKPSPAFIATGEIAQCLVPAKVTFSNTTSDATTYQWSFGDLTANDTNKAPIHTYNKLGNFDVTLIATNSGGCSNTMTQKAVVNLGPLKITSIKNLPFTGCLNTTIQMTPVITPVEKIDSYAWTFGDGFTSTDPAPQHAYSIAGKYTVSLTITTAGGCSTIFTLKNAVTVSDLPTAKFSQSSPSVCANTPIQFTDQSSVNVTSWLWNFGDGTTSTKQNPLVYFTHTGSLVNTLTVSNNSCKSVFSGGTTTILPPFAAFTVNKQQCQKPTLKEFTDVSIGAPQTILWDFGDHSPRDVNPQHTYADTGTYTVSLFVTNGACKDTATQIIKVIDPKPSFKTNLLADTLCKYTSVKFQATQYDPSLINSFYWDFGDLVTVAFKKADSLYTHSYNGVGIFSPLLITQDILGCTDSVKGLKLTVFGPTAKFSSNVVGTCVKIPVPFINQSTTDGMNNIVKWIWDYGDGKIDTLLSFSVLHAYNSADTFSIHLKVMDSYGCTDTIGGPKIIITDPKANFSISDSIRCTNNSITFTNLSTGLSLTNSWDLGNGINSVIASPPVNTYSSEKVYTANLVITDKFGCTDTKSKIITIINPVASFSLTDTFARCPPLIIHPVNTSDTLTYPAGSDLWQFGDGNTSTLHNPVYTFTNGGDYQISLVVHGYGQCYDTAYQTVKLQGSSGILSYPIVVCKPSKVTISAVVKNTQDMTWDFGDGVVVTNTDSSILHTYTGYGLYSPKLLLSDSSGCVVTVLNKDTIHVSGILAGFSTVQKIDCDSSYIGFSDSSTAYFGTLSSYSWNFGDGSAVSTLPNVKHPYLRSGNYTFSHLVKSIEGCIDSLTSPINVVVQSRPSLVITAVDSICISSSVQFDVKDTSIVGSPITSWQWDYDDGGIDITQQPVHSFNNSGNFTIQVAGTNSDGCVGITSHELEVLPLPIIYMGSDTTLCLGQSITLNPKGADSYLWINQPTLSCNQCSNPIALPLSNTFYYVTGTTLGCKAIDSILINVKMPFSLVVAPYDTLCIGKSIQLNATGGHFYHWLPANGLSDANIANPIANPSTTATYTLIASDEMNCFSDTSDVKISLFANPFFNIIDSNITMLLGHSQLLRTEGAEEIVKWEWAPTYGLDCSNCSEPNTTTSSNIEYTAKAYNIQGCMSSDHITVNVFCLGANVFIPNTFSPNGNGMNERFYPRGIGLFEISMFQVFNSYGVLVFEKRSMTPNEASDGWDGTYKGKPAPTGVYVFVTSIMCKNNTVFKIKGNVALIR